jgi:hypothetical protein
MNSESALDTLNFSSFIKNMHGGAKKNKALKLNDLTSSTQPTLSETSPFTKSQELVMTVKKKSKSFLSHKHYLKIVVAIIALYVLYQYFISDLFKKTRLGKRVSSYRHSLRRSLSKSLRRTLNYNNEKKKRSVSTVKTVSVASTSSSGSASTTSTTASSVSSVSKKSAPSVNTTSVKSIENYARAF